MKKVNILLGRFQPFTKGHYRCINEAYTELNIPTVICWINTPYSKVDSRHPFPTDMLIHLYSDLFHNDNKVESIITVANADIVKLSQKLRDLGYEATSWTCGSDRYDTYNNMSIKYHEMANLPDDFRVIEVARTSEDISATKVRLSLLEDNRDLFDALMPDCNSTISDELYNTLKVQIDKVNEKSEKLENCIKRFEALLNTRINESNLFHF